jgi:hypothetical protein
VVAIELIELIVASDDDTDGEANAVVPVDCDDDGGGGGAIPIDCHDLNNGALSTVA